MTQPHVPLVLAAVLVAAATYLFLTGRDLRSALVSAQFLVMSGVLVLVSTSLDGAGPVGSALALGLLGLLAVEAIVVAGLGHGEDTRDDTGTGSEIVIDPGAANADDAGGVP